MQVPKTYSLMADACRYTDFWVNEITGDGKLVRLDEEAASIQPAPTSAAPSAAPGNTPKVAPCMAVDLKTNDATVQRQARKQARAEVYCKMSMLQDERELQACPALVSN